MFQCGCHCVSCWEGNLRLSQLSVPEAVAWRWRCCAWWMGFTRPEDRGLSHRYERWNIYLFTATGKSIKHHSCFCLCAWLEMQKVKKSEHIEITQLFLFFFFCLFLCFFKPDLQEPNVHHCISLRDYIDLLKPPDGWNAHCTLERAQIKVFLSTLSGMYNVRLPEAALKGTVQSSGDIEEVSRTLRLWGYSSHIN